MTMLSFRGASKFSSKSTANIFVIGHKEQLQRHRIDVNVIEDFQVSFNSPVMLTDNHMNIILYQIFSSTVYILLSSFLLFNLLLKALKIYNLPFSKLQHGLCKPTRTQTNVGQKIKCRRVMDP